jgi:hypothetical protein
MAKSNPPSHAFLVFLLAVAVLVLLLVVLLFLQSYNTL